jgi:hypothetical protein
MTDIKIKEKSMSFPSYSLEVISHHHDFDNKTFRKHHLQGIDTIGAYGDEPFEIRFVNHTYNKVQVIISLDGTNILSGKPATTEVSKDMWVVNGYGSLSIRAWPETSEGGAAFVFTNANNSVALHTHGDLSSRGIIAAAVFVEGYVKPATIVPQNHHHYHYGCVCGCRSLSSGSYVPIPYTICGSSGTFDNYDYSQTYGSAYNESIQSSNSSISFNSCDSKKSAGGSMRRSRSVELTDGDDVGCNMFCETSEAEPTTKSLESLASVGAGQYTEQNIKYVTGLIKPIFQESVRVRYVWYDDLVKLIKEHQVAEMQPSGFPGDKEKTHINLGCTPRIEQQPARMKEGCFHRVDDHLLDRFC